MTTQSEPAVFEFDEIDWVNERKKPNQAPMLMEAAEKTGGGARSS